MSVVITRIIGNKKRSTFILFQPKALHTTQRTGKTVPLHCTTETLPSKGGGGYW